MPTEFELGKIEVLADVIGEQPDEVALQDVDLGHEQHRAFGVGVDRLGEFAPVRAATTNEVPARRACLGVKLNIAIVFD